MDDRQTDELFVRSNQMDLVEAFADDLAHEIKNPLHSISLHLEILRRRIVQSEEVAGAEIEKYFGRLTMDVERASGRLELLLRLMRSSRERSGATLNEIVHSVEELFHVEAKRRSLRLELDLAAAGGRVGAPVPAVRQTLLNMLLVACGRASEHAILTVRTRRAGEGAEFSLLLRVDAPTAVPDGRDEVRGSAERVAGAFGLPLHFFEGAADGEDWGVSVRIPLASGTPGASAGV